MIDYKRVLIALARGAFRRRQLAMDEGEIIGWATHEDGQHYPIHAAQGGSSSNTYEARMKEAQKRLEEARKRGEGYTPRDYSKTTFNTTKEKPKRRNKAAENLIEYIKHQTGVDLEKYRDTDYEKRGELLVNWNKIPKNEKNHVENLARMYGGKYEFEYNGGLGMILRPIKEGAK